MIATGLARSASATESARSAPLATSASALAWVRFQTVVRRPAVSRALAIAAPIFPRPITATSV